jgi:hypothetical protein
VCLGSSRQPIVSNPRLACVLFALSCTCSH